VRPRPDRHAGIAGTWSRTPLRLSALLFFVAAATAGASPADERVIPAPAEEIPQIRGLIDRARASLGVGAPVSQVLADDLYMPAHAWPRFRDAIRDHAASGPVTMVPATEPGTPLRVRGTVRDAAGRPLAGALVYAYHTSAKGWYSDKAAHITGGAGDPGHARLFVYLKTDAEGRYDLSTIRPAGYPESDLPAHIHVHITPEGAGASSWVTEILFDDDPRLTPEARERSGREGLVICPVSRGADGSESLVADLRLP
jgi:hypothetical protein